MKIVSIITARGGSKEIPMKNLSYVGGKPLISYSINASIDSNLIRETWVSTDDEMISKTAVKYGARVLWRPNEISQDDSSSELSLLHFAENVDFDILVFIQPTSPMINVDYINKGIAMMSKYDSVFTAVEKHWIPSFDENVNPIGWNIDNRPMRQDMPKTYEDAGMFYITSKKSLLKTKLRYSGKVGMVKIPLKDSFQIDSKEDLDLVNKLL